MNKYFKIILLLLFPSIIYANTLNINNTKDSYQVLPYSKVYIDKTKELTLEDIKNKEFKSTDKNQLSYGYSPDFNVWIKFTLTNNTNKSINKLLEYANPLTSYIELYDISEKSVQTDGLFNINQDRKSINPIFSIKLKPNETKTFYLKASSKITTLIIKLNLHDTDTFYQEEIKHQLVLALFFGAMFILGIYNLFIYFFTKDISYLYYVIYIFGIVIHHIMYVGIAYIYIIPSDLIQVILDFAALIVILPIFALGLFTKYFLNIKQYPKLNTILNIFLTIVPIYTIVFIVTDTFDKYRSFVALILFVYLITITVYSTLKKNRQAYFILTGWFMIFIAMFLMYLSSSGIFDIYKYSPHFVEIALVLEGIIFSIALADRINILQKEKNIADKKLILQQKNEQKRLEIQVEEKTKDLQKALDEKGLLLKELNHRVKNNMQTIISLIRLQYDDIEDDKIKDIFITIQNRINAMSHLHELLYKQDNIAYVDAYSYFDVLIDELIDSYSTEDIHINLDIHTALRMEETVYCGLIVNELVSNSFKYAFENKKGEIHIKLNKQDNYYILDVEDNGKGYDINKNSLGLTLVDTLVKHQLKGEININPLNGVKTNIKWHL